MKLLHVGDLHLGRSLGDFDLKDDQEYMLDRLLEIVDERAVDAVLIAGDVYDRAIPSEAATGMLDRFLSSLAERKVSTFMISGNHDSDERLRFGSSLFESSHIF
ncbi:MAG: exonuclease subunit SbcD, partial [Lachnospiraceae bacterium]|nr:exonuclease subunit SbcD [Lachnospiraceae bacterium]